MLFSVPHIPISRGKCLYIRQRVSDGMEHISLFVQFPKRSNKKQEGAEGTRSISRTEACRTFFPTLEREKISLKSQVINSMFNSRLAPKNIACNIHFLDILCVKTFTHITIFPNHF